MAFSSLIRTAVLKNSVLKSIPTQILRSSSLCVKSCNNEQSPLHISKMPLTTPQVTQSKILAKYLSSTPALRSADGKGHDHVTIWKLERVLSVALLPLIPAALAAPSPLLDTLVAGIVVMHTHWGLEALVVDYVRPILFGEIGPKIGMAFLYVFSAVTLAGCLNLIYNDVGLANAFLAIWKL